MANGKWQMANGKWQMADGKWQMVNDQMANWLPFFDDLILEVGVQLDAFWAKPMGYVQIQTVVEVGFDLLPILLVIPDGFAMGADGQQFAQSG